MSDPQSFRCSAAARWLGRTLAAAVLVSSMLLSSRIYPGVEGSLWSGSRTLVLLVGAVLALVIVRTGARTRAAFALDDDGLTIALGKHRRQLPWDQVVSMSYEHPFVVRREWLPAMVLTDRFEKRWRVPALLERGAAFVDEVVRVAARDDLESFASAHGLREKMARTRTRLVVGYVVAASLVLASLWLSSTGPAA